TDAASSSTPNHIAMIAGQTGSNDQTIHVHGCLSPDNDVVLQRDASGDESYGQPCYKIPSIPAEAAAAGLTWKYYGTAPVWDAPPPQVDGIGLGPRVPLLVISPWAKPGYISSQQGEFASFDKFIEQVFSLPSLGARDSLAATSDLMDYFNFSQTPDPKLIEAK